jgi:hypothetical protein
MMCCYFFERVGILLHRKLIDIKLIDDLFSIAIKSNWEKVKPIVEGRRKEFNIPAYWEYFEYLYNEMQKREQKLQQSKAKAQDFRESLEVFHRISRSLRRWLVVCLLNCFGIVGLLFQLFECS